VAHEADVLAIDTASPFPAVALIVRGEVIEESLPADRRVSEQLLSAVSRCLAHARTSLDRISRLALCAGPGSFTGLRIGLATAWGFSRCAGIPGETVSTLAAMAEAWREVDSGTVWTALDAGRGEVVFQQFHLEGSRARPLGVAARAPGASAVEAARGSPLVSLPRNLLGPEGPELPVSPARALAVAVARAPGATATGPLEPIYARASAAEEKHGTA
jgi:tRNA threonylcarbamoyladenosine biosynthesis protein TsaB